MHKISESPGVGAAACRLWSALVAGLCVALAATGGASAMGPGSEMEQLQQRLTQIQDRALEENEALRERQEELEALMRQVAREAGYDPDDYHETMEGIREQMRDPETTADERAALFEKGQEAEEKLQRGRQAAHQSDEVREARAEFREELLDAMAEVDSQVPQLLEDMRDMQQGREPSAVRREREALPQTQPVE